MVTNVNSEVVTWPSEQISFITTMRLPILQFSCRIFSKASHHPGTSAPLQPTFDSLRLLAFPKAIIPAERKETCECDGHTAHKLSQRRFTADWLAPRDSDCSRMHSKVASDRLPSYIKAKRPFLDIFKMAGYIPDSPRTCKERPQGTVESSHIGRCARISESANVKYKTVIGNNITCAINCKHRIAAKLCTLYTWFVSGICKHPA